MKIAVMASLCLSLASCVTTDPNRQSSLSPAVQASLERLGVSVITSLEAAAQAKIDRALKVQHSAK